MIDEFKIGEYVLYAKDGVCLVEDIAPLDFSPDKPYYILKPVNSKGSTVYVPTDSEKLVSKMHRLMNKAEIDDLLLNIENLRAAQWQCVPGRGSCASPTSCASFCMCSCLPPRSSAVTPVRQSSRML